MERFDKLKEEMDDTLTKYQRYLEEGVDEAILWDTVKGVWQKFMNKLKEIWDTFVQKLIWLKRKLLEIWDEGIDSMLSFFEMDISVRVNPYVNL